MPAVTDFQSLMLIDTDFDSILSNPILDIAARFWDEERYHAFKVCYRSMREIDDLVDLRKSSNEKLTADERTGLAQQMQQHLRNVSVNPDILKTVSKFQIPLWPWQRLTKAMIYDIEHDGFKSLMTFLRYAEGAAISPASVFVHLCGVENNNGSFKAPNFDIRNGARALALFSYLVHIMRDFEKDQKNNLNYFADDILDEIGISKDSLKNFAESKLPDEKLIKLFSRYKYLAGYYKQKAEQTLSRLLPLLESRYQLSLQIIYSLYLQIFDKIQPDKAIVFSETNPTPSEVQRRIDLTVSKFKPAN